MSYSRRQLYALGEPIGDSATYKEGGRTIYGDGGGGGGSSQPTQSTTYSTNIPEYAAPYVQNMLNAAQNQVYTMDGGQVTGFKPYTPYSTDPSNYVAGFSPMQQQAFSTAANMQVPPEYGAATGLAGVSGARALGLAGSMAGAGSDYVRAATDPRSVAAFMSPYQQNVVDYQKMQAARDYQIADQSRRAQAVGAGAFGGSRQAIQESEAQRALMSQLQGIQATGSQQAFQNAQQAQQYAANLGLQGQQGALQGLQGTLSAASTLGQLGTSQLGAETNIANLQSSMGAQQQAQQQKMIDQSIQNYATAQQYPYMQLGIINSLLRGLPMQSTTTQSYQATPSTGQQLAGLGISGLGAYKAMSGFKEGGEVQGYASRGLAEVSRGVEGSIQAKLEMMSPQQLDQVRKTSPSAEIRAMAEQVLAEHQMRDAAEKKAEQAIAQERAAKPQIPQEAPAGLAAAPAPNMDTINAAGGGIIAFANEGLAESDEEREPTLEERLAGIKDPKMRAAAERYTGLQAALGANKDPYADYRKFLTGEKEGLSKQRDYVIGSGLMDFGARLASTAGPVGVAAAESLQGALPGFQRGVADYRTQRAGLYKGEADIAAKDIERAGKATEGALKDYEAGIQRETELERARIAAGPGYASANRPTDLMNAYSINLRNLAGGDPAKLNDPKIQAQAMGIASNQLRGTETRLGQQQTTIETTALKEDKDLQNLYKQKRMLGMTPKLQQKNADALLKVEEDIVAQEARVLARARRQQQTAAPATDAGGSNTGYNPSQFKILPTS